MKEINTALVMSDLHLGRDLGYLYSRGDKYQKNRAAFLGLLKSLGPQDEIILNGDLLELSMAGLDEVYYEIKEFFSLLSEAPPFNRIVYIPGNHDHHFWRELAEQACVNRQINQGKLPPGHDDYPYCFVDKRFSSSAPNLQCDIILCALWPKDKRPVEIVVKYPHHLLKVSSANGKERHYLFTHGHFLEDMFTPINFLIEPAWLGELEAFNNFWIEAFDYDFGRSGRLMDRARDLVSKFEKGDKEAKKEVKKLLNEVYLNVVNKLNLKWPKTLLLRTVKCIAGVIIKKIPLEKQSGLFKAPIDDALKKRVEEYIKNYVTKRYRKEMFVEYNLPSKRDIPTPFTFVFGHTHRPFGEERRETVTIDGKTYPLANTGGWLRIDGTGTANGENAGVLVIDQTGARWESLEGKLE